MRQISLQAEEVMLVTIVVDKEYGGIAKKSFYFYEVIPIR